MFCPRCGRPVSETANFCGGCGLPKAEILRLNSEKVAKAQPAPVQTPPIIQQPVDTKEVNDTIDQLTQDLSGLNPMDPQLTATEPVNEETPQIVLSHQPTRLPEDISPLAPNRDEYDESGYGQDKIEQPKTEVIPQATQAPKVEDIPQAQPIFKENAQGQGAYNSQGKSAYETVTPTQAGTQTQYGSASSWNTAPAQPFQGDQNLSTVDFIWVMILSMIPVVGMFYMIYLAFVQDKNINKRSYARASLIISVFAAVIGIVFFVGLVGSQLIFY